MQLGRLNHIGVITLSIEQSIKMYQGLLGAEKIGVPFDMPEFDVRICFIDTPNTQIELIEALSDKSPIMDFLVKNPVGGQHHVCFEVPDIQIAVAELVEKGAVVLGEPRIGAHGTPIIFIDPGDTGGVLIELMESSVEHQAHL